MNRVIVAGHLDEFVHLVLGELETGFKRLAEFDHYVGFILVYRQSPLGMFSSSPPMPLFWLGKKQFPAFPTLSGSSQR
jgi:hypothetical protein